MSNPADKEWSLSVATAVLIWAVVYDLFAYLPWRMAVLVLVTAIVAILVVLFRPPSDFKPE
jgi:hypothetical protein